MLHSTYYRSPPGLRILAYHGVTWDTSDHLTVTPHRFADQMAWLHDNDIVPLALDTAVRRLGPATDAPTDIALTFDDGYADFVDHALPILERHGFTATLFVVSDRLGGVADWLRAAETRPLLTAATLRDLSVLGYAIGSHSQTHLRLPQQPRDVVVDEMDGSRQRLADVLGFAPTGFAYPYGAHGAREAEAVAQAGFSWACGIEGGVNKGGTNRYRLRRIEMWSGYSITEFRALLTASIPWPRLVRAARHTLGGLHRVSVDHHP